MGRQSRQVGERVLMAHSYQTQGVLVLVCHQRMEETQTHHVILLHQNIILVIIQE